MNHPPTAMTNPSQADAEQRTCGDGMRSSVFQRLLGDDFQRLCPQLQAQYGIHATSRRAFRGRGVLEEITRGLPYVVPFLWLGSKRNIMFHQAGRDVPFTIENYAYIDRFGRETLTWTRTFNLPAGVRRFDETMIYSEKRGCAVVYAGTHQHLAVDLFASVDAQGGLNIRTGQQRLYEWRVGIRFPLLFSGVARARQWFDPRMNCYRIDLKILNPLWGKIFAYHGTFHGELTPCNPEDIPTQARRVREEMRE